MTVYSAIYLSAGVVATAAAALAWRRRSSLGGLWLLLMLLAAAWWCFFDAMEASAAGIPAHVLWAQVAYLGNMTVGTFLLLFSLEHTERRRLPGWAIGALFVAPAVGVAGAATNGWHHLIWTHFALHSDPRWVRAAGQGDLPSAECGCHRSGNNSMGRRDCLPLEPGSPAGRGSLDHDRDQRSAVGAGPRTFPAA